MFQLILMLILARICIYSLVSNICPGGILQSTDKQPIDRMQEMKRHWSSLLRCLKNWFDKTWLSEAKVMKLHHSYQQIGTSSQQTHTSQVSMKMWSKVGQENPKKENTASLWNCVVCTPNKMAEVAVKSIQKWDYTSRCHLQDHKIWLAAILFGC